MKVHYNHFKIIVFLILLFAIQANAQQLDSAQIQMINMAEKFTYGFSRGAFEEQKLYYKTDEEYVLPWKMEAENSPDEYGSALDTLETNTKLSIDTRENFGTTLRFESFFPKNVTNMSALFELDLIRAEVSNDGKEYEIEKGGFTGFGNKFLSGYKDDKSYSYSWTTVNKSFNIKSEEKVDTLHGTITFLAKVKTDYQYELIKPGDKGKEFTINNRYYRVVDIFNNKVVLELLSEVGDEESTLDLEFVNVDDAGNKISQIAYFDLVKMQEEDSTINLGASGEGQSTISKKMYELFKANPGLELEEYKELVHSDFVEIILSEDQEAAKTKYLGPQYIIVTTAGPIENLYFYKPVYGISREITKSL